MLVNFFSHSILEFKKPKLSILDVLSESAVKFKDMSKGLWGGRSKCQYEKYFLFMRRKNILLKASVTNYSLRLENIKGLSYSSYFESSLKTELPVKQLKFLIFLWSNQWLGVYTSNIAKAMNFFWQTHWGHYH